MTEQQTTEQTEDNATVHRDLKAGEAHASPATQTPETTEAPEQGSKREARYRRELRATETERDTLRAQVESLQRAEAERMSGLEKGAALWATGVTVADLLDDDGQLDPERVAQAAQGAQETLGARPTGTPRPDLSQGGNGVPMQAGDAWANAFTPR